MTRRTLFASLIGAPVAAAWAYLAPKPKADTAKIEALVRATSEILESCQRIDTYWEGERNPQLWELFVKHGADVNDLKGPWNRRRRINSRMRRTPLT